MESLLTGSNITYVVILGLMGLLPLVFMACTSFLKISIVLSVLRNALGGGQVPSQAISGVITLVLSVYTMAPIFEKCIERSQGVEVEKSNYSVPSILEKVKIVFLPVVDFMRENTPIKERVYFLELQNKRRIKSSVETQSPVCDPGKIDEYRTCIDKSEGVSSLLLSFIASEIRTACTIGVLIFLPFLAVDLIVSTILTALGMMMVSPVTISLPLKLLLFVMSDGWRLLMENLILSYTVA